MCLFLKIKIFLIIMKFFKPKYRYRPKEIQYRKDIVMVI